jgi:hypothetical protein
MRNGAVLLGIGVVLALALLMGAPRGTTLAQVGGEEDTATPTNTAEVSYFAIVLLEPTLTPTNTPTPTSTPTNTPTSTNVPYQIGTGNLSGGLAWWREENPFQYYMFIENIKFWQWFFNNSFTHINRYSILGVKVIWPGNPPPKTAFHTSWHAAPDYVNTRCHGPNGFTIDWNLPLRCAGDIGSGRHQDGIGAGSDVIIDQPGLYTVQYYVCQSPSASDCANGEWYFLASLQFTAVPPPSSMWDGVIPTPVGDETCTLVLTGVNRGRLECVKR